MIDHPPESPKRPDGPDFVGVGMQRCGTTWAANVLQQHPDVLIVKKEVNFFVRNYGKGMNWYENWFAEKNGRISGEFSPNYMISPRPDPTRRELYPNWNPRRSLFFWMKEKSARDELKRLYPAVKIIVLFRNPIDRAWSAYWFWRRRKERKNKKVVSFEKMWKDDGRWIRTIGLYADHLEHWKGLFPEIGVFFFDDIQSNPVKTAGALYSFLGVDESFIPTDISQKNSTAYEPMPANVRQMMSDFYRPQIEKLSNMTDRDLSHWLMVGTVSPAHS